MKSPIIQVPNNESQHSSMGGSMGGVFTYKASDGTLNIEGAHDGLGITVFRGVAYNNRIEDILNSGIHRKICDLLLRAVNNRTIERNYFRLYCDLLDGVISDDDFQQELDKNGSDYILENNITPTIEDLQLAIRLVDDIKDVQTSEDISSLFSFNSVELDKLLTE